MVSFSYDFFSFFYFLEKKTCHTDCPYCSIELVVVVLMDWQTNIAEEAVISGFKYFPSSLTFFFSFLG